MQKTKDAIGLLILLFVCITGYGQSDIKGKVIDKETQVPLEHVFMVSMSDSSITYTDTLGRFTVPMMAMYKISHIGYQSEILMISGINAVIVELKLSTSTMNEVIVSSNHLPVELKNSSSTINIVSLDETSRTTDLNISTMINTVPGIYMQSGALNTNRITIRGIGSRNLYGTAKIRAYYDDIPLTSGSGETSIEDLELGSISKMEIIKGANASIYGAGLGGTIHLVSQKPYLNEKSISTKLSIGSYGLKKGIVNVNIGNKKHSLRTVYSNTSIEGYRDNSDYKRETITLNSNHFINSKNQISFLGSYINLNASIPSSINKNKYLNEPKSAAFTWAKAKGMELGKKTLLGLSWKHQYKDNLRQITSVFNSYNDADEDRPFNILEANTVAYGIRSRIIGDYMIGKNQLTWTIGGERFRDLSQSKTYKNLYKDEPVDIGSIRGSLLSDIDEDRQYYNLFFETNYQLLTNTFLSFGINLNKTVYQLDDNYTSSNHVNQSGSYSFKNILSPKIGLSHQFNKNIGLYGNISHGFSPPSLSETLLPDGQVNTDIKPESGWNYEIGTRGSYLSDQLHFNLAFYRLDIKDLLVARRIDEDQYIGVNAGRTIHDGIEAHVDYRIINTRAIKWSSYISYTLNDFVFDDFEDDGKDYSGNKLTGVPSDMFNIGTTINSKMGLYGKVNYQYIASMPMNDNNTLFSDSYQLLMIKVGYNQTIKSNITIHPFIGINNLLNEKYASQILINAKGFGGKAPRYYYPGNPRNYYGGLSVKYGILR